MAKDDVPSRTSRSLWPSIIAGLIAFGWASGCRFVSGEQPRDNLTDPVQSKGALLGTAWAEGKLESRADQGQPKLGGEVSVRISSEPPSLNPIIDTDYWGDQIALQIYETLVRVDPYDNPRFRFEPALAESWTISGDQKTYTFALRKNVRWHDGQPFTADDVMATMDKVQDTTSKAAHLRSYTEEIEKYEKVDDFTVRFILKRPYFFIVDGVFASLPIQPANRLRKLTGVAYSESATNPLLRAPIGTGPFRFETWTSGVKISLARNPSYWGKAPYLDRVTFRIILDPTVALELAESGELDVVWKLVSAQWGRLNDSPLRRRFQRSIFYDANYAWIGWNMKRPQLADVRVRQALTLLIDRPRIIRYLLKNLAKPTACHFYWASDACDPALSPPPYDPLKAVELLERAGWIDRDGDGIRDLNGRPLRIVLMLPSGAEESARMATKIKEDFERAGIELQVQRVEWAAFTRRLRTHDFDACILVWMGGPRDDPSQVWQSTSVNDGSNYVGFANADADRLIRQARGELDDQRRNTLYRKFGRILYDEQPYTWIYVRPQLALFNRRVKGVENTLLGWVYSDWWVDDSIRAAKTGD